MKFEKEPYIFRSHASGCRLQTYIQQVALQVATPEATDTTQELEVKVFVCVVYMCFETRWIGQKRGFYVPERTYIVNDILLARINGFSSMDSFELAQLE